MHAQTIRYRAPEVMLTDGQYGRESDVWSIATTLFEMVFRRYAIDIHPLNMLPYQYTHSI